MCFRFLLVVRRCSIVFDVRLIISIVQKDDVHILGIPVDRSHNHYKKDKSINYLKKICKNANLTWIRHLLQSQPTECYRKYLPSVNNESKSLIASNDITKNLSWNLQFYFKHFEFLNHGIIGFYLLNTSLKTYIKGFNIFNIVKKNDHLIDIENWISNITCSIDSQENNWVKSKVRK